MKKILLFFPCIIFFASCSEGDIIDTSVNFEATPEDCFNEDNFVIYKIDSDGKTAISLNFTSATFETNRVPENNEEEEIILLNGNSNILTYRMFDQPIAGDTYFCSNIPPANIMVIQELIANSGTATITYTPDPTNQNVFTRTITLTNVTFVGPEIEIREQVYDFGSYQITTTP